MCQQEYRQIAPFGCCVSRVSGFRFSEFEFAFFLLEVHMCLEEYRHIALVWMLSFQSFGTSVLRASFLFALSSGALWIFCRSMSVFFVLFLICPASFCCDTSFASCLCSCFSIVVSFLIFLLLLFSFSVLSCRFSLFSFL